MQIIAIFLISDKIMSDKLSSKLGQSDYNKVTMITTHHQPQVEKEINVRDKWFLQVRYDCVHLRNHRVFHQTHENQKHAKVDNWINNI